jgi:multiple sugar transport system substrate-binding protein
MLKRFFACLLTVALLLCSFSFALADDQQTIHVLWWGSQTRHDATTKMIEKFMEKYPNIKVEIELTDWTGYWSKLATQAAGGWFPMLSRWIMHT